MMTGDRRHNFQSQGLSRRINYARFKSISLKCLVACLIYLLLSDFMFQEAAQLRRSLSCHSKKSALLRKKRKLKSYYDQGKRSMMDEDETNESVTDLYDQIRNLITSSADEECGIIFPEDVIVETGTDSYYVPLDEDAGLYYAEENEQIPPAEIEEITNPEGEVDPTVLVPDVNEPMYYSEVDTTLLGLFEPAIYEPVNETANRPEGTTAFTVTITSCPETYDAPSSEVTDPGGDIYEASCLLKNQACFATEDTTTAGTRRLKRQRDLMETTTDNFTMYAIIHPEAINCLNTDGSSYNRVKLLQQQGYYVEILGQPITSTDLYETQPYIKDHIDQDVGIKDSIALHAFTFEEHKAVVVLDYNTQLLQPLHDEINDLVADPNKQVKYVRDKDGGVSKNGFMIIKPSKAKFEEIRQEYINTPYDPITGWNGEGHNTFNGKMGLKGFFSYKASKDPSWEELDRCIYNNQLDDFCISQIDVDNSKVVRHSKKVCGEPRDCPYDHPKWSAQKKMQCRKSHEKYFKSRDAFETKYLIKSKIQEPVGLFKSKSFMGFCKGPGRKNYLGFTKAVYRKPDWQILCPRMQCPPGTYVKNDCTCTALDNPCDACPGNTRCQLVPELWCIDCNCGFCDSSRVSCCDFNGINNCKDGEGLNNDCIMQKDFFPAFADGSGNVCSGVEISDTAQPNGCGCKPNDTTPCTYNPDLQDRYDDRCFICTTEDIANGGCPSCNQCLETCDPCIAELSSSNSVDKYKQCLKRMDETCRVGCNVACNKPRNPFWL
eukprot:CAMPEP_0203662284 /NCGR_PEP_ID=MMETSP0090-20130426/301_1 /ASSEMBLY_ACC=CAM_ASM_001088 /TAXON_ID=426623 /ORGANISM="Chaetoceros affinis, Strain CCMP159" /LENGTH=773 /DNA_ID=CAMNT_0050525047 /DNA_START=39 /DNA_END=2360 /DNA_ORIENTATION=+